MSDQKHHYEAVVINRFSEKRIKAATFAEAEKLGQRHWLWCMSAWPDGMGVPISLKIERIENE